jgi:uncharacterized membrane-anchored protein
MAIGLLLYGLVLATSEALAHALGRDVDRLSSLGSTWQVWVAFVGSMLGWMLFVYLPTSRRIRVLTLALLLGGAAVISCVVTIACSPPIPS